MMMRPRKKARTESHHERTTQACSTGCCALQPILKEFVELKSLFPSGGDDSLYCLIQQATSVLKARGNKGSDASIMVDAKSCKRLHGILIMHIGFAMLTAQSTRIHTGDNMDRTDPKDDDERRYQITVPLLGCLRTLYSSFSFWATNADQEEFQESLLLIQKIILEVSTEEQNTLCTIYGYNAGPCRTLPRQEVLAACWKVFSLILDCGIACKMKVLHKHGVQIEQIIMSRLYVLRRICTISRDNASESTERDAALTLLRKMQNQLPRSNLTEWQNLSTAITVISSRRPSLDYIEASTLSAKQILRSREWVFQWKCLAVSSYSLMLFGEDFNAAIQRLHLAASCFRCPTSCHIQGGNLLAIEATECLCHFARKIAPEHTCGALVGALSRVVQLQSCKIRRAAQPGVVAFLGRDDAMDMFLKMDTITNLLNSAATCAVDEDDRRASREFTDTNLALIVAGTIAYLIDRPSMRQANQVLWKALLCNLYSMLESDEDAIVSLSVTIILQLSEKSRTLQEDALKEKLIPTMAKIALNGVTSLGDKHRIMKIFANLLDGGDSNDIHLPREPKVLEALVQVAALQRTTSSWTETRKLALRILLRLSDRVCNRRILAKQPGLLSTLIRFARRNGRGDDEDGLIPREDMKKKILLLARAL